MGRKKRGNAQTSEQQDPKRIKEMSNETGEKYLVKKYRPDKIYAAMDAFVKYTKSHRMLDASYIRWKTGVTPEKPFVFSTRVGGQDLGWGRGRTREAAMDAACRAAFALVAAHGYNNFPLDDDCLMEPPMDPLPPPPPPPPPGMPGMYPGAPPHMVPPGMPPMPPGLPPGLPPLLGSHAPPLPPAQASTVDLIPQAKLVSESPPTASSLSTGPTAIHAFNGSGKVAVSSSNLVTPAPSTVTMTLGGPDSGNGAAAASSNSILASGRTKTKKKLKGGLTLVYDPDGENEEEEMSMEETRAMLPRYQKMLLRALNSSSAVSATA